MMKSRTKYEIKKYEIHKDISKKQQKSILDYTQNYLTELIPLHFVKLHKLLNMN